MSADDAMIPIRHASQGMPGRDLIVTLAEAILALPDEDAVDLTYGRLTHMAGLPGISAELFGAVNFLTSSRCAILDCFGSLRIPGEDPVRISAASFQGVLDDNILVHPVTGETLVEAQDLVTLTYERKGAPRAEEAPEEPSSIDGPCA